LNARRIGFEEFHCETNSRTFAEAQTRDDEIFVETFRRQAAVYRCDQERGQENYKTRARPMSEFRNKLKELDDDALDAAAAAVSREKARRSQRPVTEMTDTQYLAWADDQIKKAERAKAAEAAKEQNDV
jgi:sarcosine oxidase gamma subunit